MKSTGNTISYRVWSEARVPLPEVYIPAMLGVASTTLNGGKRRSHSSSVTTTGKERTPAQPTHFTPRLSSTHLAKKNTRPTSPGEARGNQPAASTCSRLGPVRTASALRPPAVPDHLASLTWLMSAAGDDALSSQTPRGDGGNIFPEKVETMHRNVAIKDLPWKAAFRHLAIPGRVNQQASQGASQPTQQSD